VDSVGFAADNVIVTTTQGNLMAATTYIRDLDTVQIARLLAADNDALSTAEVAALQEFIEEIGGIENASSAVEMLLELERSA
jgi:hypothetical protein